MSLESREGRNPRFQETGPEKHNTDNRKVSLRQRIHHFTWAWYTLTMSTGGMALLLSVTPHRFPGLDTIGAIVYIFDLVLFTCISMAITARFVMFKGTLFQSLTHPTESLFFGTMLLSLATIICGMQKYGEPNVGGWLVVVLRIVFWIYCATTFLVASFQYWRLFDGQHMPILSMSPAWILPIFPVMLSGTIANVISPSQPDIHARDIIVAGVTFQGLGMMVSFLMYSSFIGRLMQSGLPEPNSRPGMFIAVGPPSFTALALIGMANSSSVFTASIIETAVVPADVLKIMALFLAIFLWSLSLWFFSISLISVLAVAAKMSFHLSWWSLVFPNIGFTIATIEIGTLLKSEGILWLGSVMTVMIVAIWLFVIVAHVHAVTTSKIMYPGKDEDKEEEYAGIHQE
ncbi:hypothetical protein BP6252_05918 [Coleophoma cylindrospora]|uniref:Malic acid transport protein n=1 Tax=Coleophoma cylindrospora TaxID=1849047 RepID=A0A3D8RLG7_9HELO|nr:hypothetical protein BP6252_05918 [Coleophoma cylindrospora]